MSSLKNFDELCRRQEEELDRRVQIRVEREQMKFALESILSCATEDGNRWYAELARRGLGLPARDERCSDGK